MCTGTVGPAHKGCVTWHVIWCSRWCPPMRVGVKSVPLLSWVSLHSNLTPNSYFNLHKSSCSRLELHLFLHLLLPLAAATVGMELREAWRAHEGTWPSYWKMFPSNNAWIHPGTIHSLMFLSNNAWIDPGTIHSLSMPSLEQGLPAWSHSPLCTLIHPIFVFWQIISHFGRNWPPPHVLKLDWKKIGG